MAIKAGRVGILPEELTPEGKIRNAGGELQPATAETLGGVKIGEGVTVAEDGTISVSGSEIEEKWLSYDINLDRWLNLARLQNITPQTIMSGAINVFANVTGNTYTQNYRIMPDYYNAGTEKTGTIHLGTIVFDYTYSSDGNWTITKQS